MEHGRPNEHLCPITLQVLKDPVVAADGHSYERAAIETYLRSGQNLSPITGVPLSNTTMVSNQALKKMINDWKTPEELTRENEELRKRVSSLVSDQQRIQAQQGIEARAAQQRVQDQNREQARRNAEWQAEQRQAEARAEQQRQAQRDAEARAEQQRQAQRDAETLARIIPKPCGCRVPHPNYVCANCTLTHPHGDDGVRASWSGWAPPPRLSMFFNC